MSSLDKNMLEVMTRRWGCIECILCEHTCYIWLALPFLWTRVPLTWMSSTYGTSRTLRGSMSTIWGATCLVYLYSKLFEACRWKMKHVRDSITLLTIIFIGFLMFMCHFHYIFATPLLMIRVFQHFLGLDPPKTSHTSLDGRVY